MFKHLKNKTFVASTHRKPLSKDFTTNHSKMGFHSKNSLGVSGENIDSVNDKLDDFIIKSHYEKKIKQLELEIEHLRANNNNLYEKLCIFENNNVELDTHAYEK